ncbi:hypothetical protein [Allosalinactinospora lopnorensis]|uniref:hypothetical protein n=1 Tax=Allosalinactinospora lopnorensis TaxID=1352348 RepID=UPI0006970E6E|nr:hypothetical protein [Allosalinactinospora lopnorensis]
MLNGDAGPDMLEGGPGNDTINGNAGNDTLTDQSGTDEGHGGPGVADRCSAAIETRTGCEIII